MTRSEELCGKMWAVQSELTGMEPDKKEHATEEYRNGLHHHLLGTAAMVNRQAVRELLSDNDDNAVITLKERKQVERRLALSEKMLDDNNRPSLSGIHRQSRQLVRAALLSNLRKDGDVELTLLEHFIQKNSYLTGEYLPLDLSILGHELEKSWRGDWRLDAYGRAEAQKLTVILLQNYAKGRFDISEVVLEFTQQCWQNICEFGHELIGISTQAKTAVKDIFSFTTLNYLKVLREDASAITRKIGNATKLLIQTPEAMDLLPQSTQEYIRVINKTTDIHELCELMNPALLIPHPLEPKQSSPEEAPDQAPAPKRRGRRPKGSKGEKPKD